MGNNEFKKGDVVVLKSGGPKMTIRDFTWNAYSGQRNNDEVLCYWFKDGSLVQDEFDVNTLCRC